MNGMLKRNKNIFKLICKGPYALKSRRCLSKSIKKSCSFTSTHSDLIDHILNRTENF